MSGVCAAASSAVECRLALFLEDRRPALAQMYVGRVLPRRRLLERGQLGLELGAHLLDLGGRSSGERRGDEVVRRGNQLLLGRRRLGESARRLGVVAGLLRLAGERGELGNDVVDRWTAAGTVWPIPATGRIVGILGVLGSLGRLGRLAAGPAGATPRHLRHPPPAPPAPPPPVLSPGLSPGLSPRHCPIRCCPGVAGLGAVRPLGDHLLGNVGKLDHDQGGALGLGILGEERILEGRGAGAGAVTGISLEGGHGNGIATRLQAIPVNGVEGPAPVYRGVLVESHRRASVQGAVAPFPPSHRR